MSLKLIVLYPHPIDVKQFDMDYAVHLRFTDEKLGLTNDIKPYTVTKMLPTPMGLPHYYQMFTLLFNSEAEMETILTSPKMQEVGADANRISTGGAPLVMVGNEN